jgi:hypothetical protein
MVKRRPRTTASSEKSQTTTDNDATTTHHQGQSLMDENDQDQMILELKAESDRMQQQMHQSFSILCVAAMVICVLVTFYLCLFPESPSVAATATDWMFRWLHTGLAALLHWEAQYFVTHPAQPMFSWKVSVSVVSLIGLLLAVSLLQQQQQQHASARTDNLVDPDDSINMLHWGLVLSNAATLVGAALLRLDSSSADNALEELRSAKYRYKSL